MKFCSCPQSPAAQCSPIHAPETSGMIDQCRCLSGVVICVLSRCAHAAIDFDVASSILSLINTTRWCPVWPRDVSAHDIRCKESETNVNHPLPNFPCTRLTPQVVT
jgi:hypothetical protein